MALVLPALTDCRWWFKSLLAHSGVSSATRRKATGADHKKKAAISPCQRAASGIPLGTFRLPCRAHPGAVPFPPQRTYTVSRCMRSPKRRQPAEASNTRPLMSLSDVACEGSHMRYFGGLVSCPPYNFPLFKGVVPTQHSSIPGVGPHCGLTVH